MKRMISLLLALVLALVLAGCGASKAAGGASDSMAASEPEAGYWSNNSKSDDSYDEDGYDAEGEPAAASDPASRPVKMIYNGYMEMQTQDFDTAASGIEALVRELGGYFQQSSVSNRGSSSYRYGSYTIRIPAAQFEAFFQRAGQLCHVTYTNTGRRRVGELLRHRGTAGDGPDQAGALAAAAGQGHQHGGHHHHRKRHFGDGVGH